MRQFDFLALIGVIAFTSSGFIKVDARSLAEVTLEAQNPFGPGWLLAPDMPASELDNVTDPINYGPIGSSADDYNGTSSGVGAGAPSGNATHHHHHHHNGTSSDNSTSSSSG